METKSQLFHHEVGFQASHFSARQVSCFQSAEMHMHVLSFDIRYQQQRCGTIHIEILILPTPGLKCFEMINIFFNLVPPQQKVCLYELAHSQEWYFQIRWHMAFVCVFIFVHVMSKGAN